MVHVIASVRVKEGQVETFLGIFKSNVATVLKEKGCIEYGPAVDLSSDLPGQELDRNVVTIIEKWSTIDDLRAHLASSHMLAYRESVKDIVENVMLKVLREA